MVRKAQKKKKRLDGRHVFDSHTLDQRKGIVLTRKVAKDDKGNVVSYSLAYIDPTICGKDNGRVLGYDNNHGYHHRHYMGKVEPFDFTSFKALEDRFEREFREIYNEHHG